VGESRQVIAVADLLEANEQRRFPGQQPDQVPGLGAVFQGGRWLVDVGQTNSPATLNASIADLMAAAR
jgi:hypothetical protein